MTEISNFVVPTTIEGLGEVIYIPDFLTIQEEEYLIRKINDVAGSKWKNLSNRRLQVWGGEVMKPSGVLVPSPLPGFLTEFPNLIERLRSTGCFSSSKIGQPNHVLINEYYPGQGIMPHEDGPSYFPTVATISLGSHAVFHYYRYLTDENDTAEQRGKPIDPKPVVSLLLEPRSLVITRNDLYTTCLHGIEEKEVDEFAVHSSSTGSDRQDGQDTSGLGRVRVMNAESIGDHKMREVVENGGSLKRDTRLSLTCRAVEKVTNVGGAANKLFGRR